MDLLHQRRLCAGESGIATVLGGYEIVAEIVAAGDQTRVRDHRHAIRQRHIDSEDVRLRRQPLIGNGLERYRAGRRWTGSVQIRDRRREGNWRSRDGAA